MTDTQFGGWTIHMQAAIRYDPQGYDQPAARYNVPEVVYGADPYAMQWVTLDCQVTRVTASHGGQVEQTPGMRADLGQLTANLYDPKRVLDPTASPFQMLTRPSVPVRLVAISPAEVMVPLWTGEAESWTHDYLSGEGELRASDLVSKFMGVTVTNWKRGNETSRARYQAAAAQVPGGFPLVFDGVLANLSAATMTGNLWDAVVKRTGEAEQAIVWVDQYGRLRRTDSYNQPPPLLARDCDDGVCDLVFTRLGSVWDRDDLTNVVSMERLNIGDVDRNPVVRQNNASVAQYGPITLSNTELPLLDDAALINWGDRVLDLRAFPVAEPTGLGVTLQNNFPWVGRTVGVVATLEIGDILDVALTSQGEQASWLAAVAQITHNINTTTWDVALELVDGPRYAANSGYDSPASVYDVSVYGRTPGVAPVEVTA